MWQFGCKVHTGGVHFIPSSEGRKPRGKVSSFSPAARRRLREALLVYDLAVDSYRFGLTLTLPWKCDSWGDPELDSFRECFNRFGIAFRRARPRWAAIFRVELQQRGAPHIHAIVYAPVEEFRGIYTNVLYSRLHDFFWGLWWDALKHDLKGGSLDGFYRYGIRADYIRTEAAIYRYLADHATKSKQAQLGYRGKQWGILNRKALVRRPPLGFAALEGDVLFRFNRALRKICRYRVKADCVFGSRLSKALPVRGGCRYVNLSTASRIVSWAKSSECLPPEKQINL